MTTLLGAFFECRLRLVFSRHECVRRQRAMLAAVQLLTVLQAENRGAQGLLHACIALAKLAQNIDTVVDQLTNARIASVALVFELRLRQQARGATGVAGQDHEFADLRAVAPREVVIGRVGRFAIDVGAAKREVDRVARVDKVVWVAAEVRGLQMWRHDQADVVEHPVLV